MRSLLGRLASNWKLKLAALALALLLWVVVSADQITSQWLEVPVDVRLADPGFELVQGPLPQQVQVRFYGPTRELLDVAMNRPTLVLPVGEVNGEAEYFALGADMVRLPSGLSVSARDVRPSSVLLEFGRLESREVPVAVRISRGPGEGRVLADTLGVEPRRIRIAGPAARVRAVETVYTRPLDLSREDSIFRRSVALDTAQLRGLRLSAAEVQLSGRVDVLVTRTVAGVPVATPPGVNSAPSAVEVELRGPESVVARLTRSDLEIGVSAGSVPAQIPFAGVSVPVEIANLPLNVEAGLDPEVVRIFPAPPPPEEEPVEPEPPVSDPSVPADTVLSPDTLPPPDTIPPGGRTAAG